jgi:quinoprotein glucose dehydrogenase
MQPKLKPIFAAALLNAVLFHACRANAEDMAAQAIAGGKSVYAGMCANCHGATLRGGEAGPALVGEKFVAAWKDRPGELMEKIRTMPPSTPGMLSQGQYDNLAAFVRATAGLPAAAPRTAAAKKPGITVGWPSSRGGVMANGYSNLDIINAANVNSLRVAWRWKSDNFGPSLESNMEATPVMVDGTLYTTAGSRRDVVAIDAKTGETLWMYRIDEGARGRSAQRRNAGRGLSYGRVGDRGVIYFVTIGYQLIALDARTGRPVDAFGDHGIVDVKLQSDQALDPDTAQMGNTSPPLVMNGVVVVGPAMTSGAAPASMKSLKGYVVAFDAATGKRLWVFHTIPAPGEHGSATWKNASNVYTGNAGVWGLISGDPKLGYVYLPVEEATSDYYGGHRPGDNLFTQSLVCLDVRTGKRIWYYQTIHHDIWDYDLNAPPVLLDVKMGRTTVPMVAQVTKQAFTFVFNRVTGKPVWPITERKVAASTVPGEETSPTQPFPSKPPPFDVQGFTEKDLNDLTPEIHAEAKRIAAQYTMGPLYTPPTAITPTNKGTLTMPSTMGGANWQGAVADPETGILYVGSMTFAMGIGLSHEPSISDLNYVAAGNLIVTGPFGLPLQAPPWGRITAIDLKRGDILWQVPNGDTPDAVRDHPKLKGVNIPRTGSLERAGLLVTKSLLFGGEGSGLFGTSGGSNIFRAYDKKTGKTVAEIKLPARQSGVPMTYAIDGKQYIVMAAGDKNQGGELIALTLP